MRPLSGNEMRREDERLWSVKNIMGGGTHFAKLIGEGDIRIPHYKYIQKDNADDLRCPFWQCREREIPESGSAMHSPA